MSSVTPFRFPNETELLVRSGNIPPYLYTPQFGGQSESPGDGTSISAGDSTVTSIKTENWTITSTDKHSLENQAFQQTQQEASNIDRLALLASVASESVFGSGSSSSPADPFPPNMSAYISGTNGQSETLQTLHLMNPSLIGYDDSSHSGNMVIFSSGTGAVGTGQGSPLGRSEQHQQNFARFALPSAVNQPSYAHPSHMTAMSNTEIGHLNTSADFYAKRTTDQGYGWGGGNELSFLPSGHVGERNQEINTHINLMKPGQLSSSNMSHFGVGSLNPIPYHEQTSMFANNVVPTHGVNMDNLQAPSSAGHILSLSLSPQRPSVMQQLHSFSIQQDEPTTNFFHGLSNTGSDSLGKESLFTHNKCAGKNIGGSFTIPSCENMLGGGYQHQINNVDTRQIDVLAGHLTIGSYGSKYLKPTQELLNEVVSVGQGLKSNALKRSKTQVWTAGGHSSGSDSSFVKSMNATDSPNKAIISWSARNEGEPMGTTTISTSVPSNPEAVAELSSADRQELQAKRAKLVGMRDEVDRRYKQYYHQMQVVATSFESVAGLGAAAAYTALALQTISKHFRCLKDAITTQIQNTCTALGEEEVTGLTRGETSKLRFIDQQLRQQRALRQLGMMQQQAWRPQRGLPEHSVSILRAWLFEHFLHPYPKDADKIMLAKQTGLNRNQVSNWFINARVRLWKPMVEEMYLEETKEADADRADKSSGDNEDNREGERVGVSGDASSSDFSKPFKQAKLSDENGQGFSDVKGTSIYSSDLHHARIITGSPTDCLLLQDKESLRSQGGMTLGARSQDISSLLGIDYKANRPSMECSIEGGNKINSAESGYNSLQHRFSQGEQLNLAGYGSYQLNGMSRYGQESFGGAGYGANGGVSLTLGLQHCEGIAFSGGQQQYTTQGSTTHLLGNRREDDAVGSADYYNVNESSYEVLGLQSRKPSFPAHMLCHDFVV